MAPFYLTFLFHVRISKYNLWGVKKLIVPKVTTTTFGLNTQIPSYFHLEISARWNKKRSWSEYFQMMYKAVNF